MQLPLLILNLQARSYFEIDLGMFRRIREIMPNTLAHIGLHSVATKLLIKDADIKWVYLGCLVPDIPWILQRVIKVIVPEINPYDLRLYVVIQSSLAFCLLLNLAISTLSARYWKTFFILGLGSFLHLAIDALQTKWANGVQFLVPLNWNLMNFGLFWPESFPTYFLTLFGLVYFIWNWKKHGFLASTFPKLDFTRILTGMAILSLYFNIPNFFKIMALEADNHYVETLQSTDQRSGKYVEVDRVFYTPVESGGLLHHFSGEEIPVSGISLETPSVVSIRGNFVNNHHIEVQEYHRHSRRLRDYASYLGIALIGFYWTVVTISSIGRIFK